MLASAKLRRSWYYQIYFLKLHMCVYLRTKFQVSSLILKSFRRGSFIPPPEKEHLKIPPRLGLKDIFFADFKMLFYLFELEFIYSHSIFLHNWNLCSGKHPYQKNACVLRPPWSILFGRRNGSREFSSAFNEIWKTYFELEDQWILKNVLKRMFLVK